jgi:hypothetical protein
MFVQLTQPEGIIYLVISNGSPRRLSFGTFEKELLIRSGNPEMSYPGESEGAEPHKAVSRRPRPTSFNSHTSHAVTQTKQRADHVCPAVLEIMR